MMIYPILCGFNVLANIAKYAINGLASSSDGTLFVNKTGDISDIYYVEITPAGWTFTIWGFIYTWEAIWIVYSLVNICRKSSKGPAYLPYFITPAVLILYIVGCLLNITWLITFDRQEIVAAMVSLIAISFIFYAIMFLSYRALDQASPTLVEENRTKDIWLTRAFLHNGVAMQATWVSIASLLNVAMVMTYKSDPGVSVTDSATTALALLSAEIVIFAGTDLFLLDRYSRYTITPYIVVVVALIGSLSRNYTEGARNSVFSVVLLVVASCLLLLKLTLTIYRHVKRPRFRTNYDSSIGGKIRGQLA